MEYKNLVPEPKANLDGYTISPKDVKRVLAETFAPDPKMDEIFKDFDFDGAPPL